MFLKERAKLDSPVERTIDPEARRLRPSDLPSHPAVTGALVAPDDVTVPEDRADIVLEVRRPSEVPCLIPGPSIKSWLPSGWDRVDAEVNPVNPLSLDNLQVELFDDDPRRATSFVLWRNLREDWRRSEVPNRRIAASSPPTSTSSRCAWLKRESERYRVLLGDGWLLFDHEEGRIVHPLLLQLELEFDERLPALRLRIADPIPELNSALLRLIPEVEAASIAVASRGLRDKHGGTISAGDTIDLVACLLGREEPGDSAEKRTRPLL